MNRRALISLLAVVGMSIIGIMRRRNQMRRALMMSGMNRTMSRLWQNTTDGMRMLRRRARI